MDSSQANCKEMWSITEDGWEQMKNDPEYEAWVLGYTIENRSVHFPFQASFLNVEKFGSIDRGTSWRRDSNEYGKPEKVWEKGRIMVE